MPKSFLISGDMMEKKKIRKVRYRLSVVFFGTVLIFGIMFYKYMKTTTLEDVLSEHRTITVFSENTVQKGGDNGSEETAEEQPAESSSEITNPVPESEAVGEEYLDGCVFIGDNITYGLSSYGMVPSSNVLASAALSLSKIESMEIDTSYGSMTVLQAVTEMKPQNVYVMLGSNGAAYMSPTEMYMSYSAFLNKLRIALPDSKLFVISTPPVSSVKESSAETPIKNSDLDDLNGQLLDYCNKNSVYYLDLSSALKDESGCLPADAAENDGMHFKQSTYETFINYILTHTAG